LAFDPARVQALLFDIDGTLSDTDDQMVARFSRVLHPLKRLLPNRDVHAAARWLVMWMESPGNYIYTKLDRFGLDGPVGRLLNTFSHRRANRKPKYFQVIPGVTEMLPRLAMRYPLAIVSARGNAGALAFLDQFGLRPFFQAVITAQTCEYTKPFPDPVLEAARQLELPVEACVMIGDTTVDMHSGKTAGAQTIGVLCGFGHRDELLRAGADVILETTGMVEAILAG
jgi:N-acetyl-D-muramate 6-phosphate phosphatase